MNLYTIACEFRGGSYVSQHEAVDEVAAVRAWADAVDKDQVLGRFTSRIATQLRNDLDDTPPTPLDGLTGVWCFTATSGRRLLLGNVVLTARPR